MYQEKVKNKSKKRPGKDYIKKYQMRKKNLSERRVWLTFVSSLDSSLQVTESGFLFSHHRRKTCVRPGMTQPRVCACACVRVGVCACVRACVRVCMCVRAIARLTQSVPKWIWANSVRCFWPRTWNLGPSWRVVSTKVTWSGSKVASHACFDVLELPSL